MVKSLSAVHIRTCIRQDRGIVSGSWERFRNYLKTMFRSCSGCREVQVRVNLIYLYMSF